MTKLTIFDYLKKEPSEHLLEFALNIRDKKTYREDLHYEENPYYVLERIHSRNTRKGVLNELVKLNYDFKTPFPYEKLRKSYPVLDKIKKNLLREDEHYGLYEKKGKSGITTEGFRYLLVKTPIILSKYAFRKGYDLYINCEKSGKCTIIFNPSIKKEYGLRPLFIKLSRKEKDSWTIWRGESVVRSENTKIDSKELESYIRTFIFRR